MKFYRYLIYKIYHISNDTPIANVVLTLVLVHFFQLMTIYIWIIKLFPQFEIFEKIDKIYVGLSVIIFAVIYYYLVYNKERWKTYFIEFENEDYLKSRKGTFLVGTFIIGSILLFFIS